MEIEQKIVPIAQMMPVIRAAMEEGKNVEMTVTGQSMMPLLRDRKSSVRLTQPDCLKRGDIVLYQRKDDRYVLHRIASVRNGVYDIVGDNQYIADRNVPEEKIIAKAAAYSRDGRHWQENAGLYRTFLPLIRTVKGVGHGLKRKLRAWRRE